MQVYSSVFYILSNFHTLSSKSMYYILYLTSCILSSMAKSYMLYSIMYLVSTIFNIVYVYSKYMLCLRFQILHSIYTTYFNFYTLTSESTYYIQYLTSCFLSSMTSILYAIFDIVSCIYYIQYCICAFYIGVEWASGQSLVKILRTHNYN